MAPAVAGNNTRPRYQHPQQRSLQLYQS
jgi:hypothetical protein